MVRFEEVADLALQRQRQRTVAGERGGAGAVDAEGFGGLDRGGLDLGVRGQAQIVLRAEIDAVHGAAGVVLGDDSGPRAGHRSA